MAALHAGRGRHVRARRADADVRAVERRARRRGPCVVRCSSTRRRRRAGGAAASSAPTRSSNALAAAAAALALGVPLDASWRSLLSDADPRSRWRMEVTDAADGVTVVNDAYNANPESVRAALDALVAIGDGPPDLGGARRDARARRRVRRRPTATVGRLAVDRGVDRLVVVGEAAARSRDGRACGRRRPRRATSSRGRRRRRGRAARARAVRPGDVVLVKASRAVGLETVADALLAAGADRRSMSGGGPVKLVLDLRRRRAARHAVLHAVADPAAAPARLQPGDQGVGRVQLPRALRQARHAVDGRRRRSSLGVVARLLRRRTWSPGAGVSASGLLVLFLVAGLGLVGFADDYIKIFKQRSLGLRASTKFGGQAVVAVVFAILALQFENDAGPHSRVPRDLVRARHPGRAARRRARDLGRS